MPDQVYEVVAQGARYWFLFLMVLIVWRSWRWYRKDKKQAKKRLRLLPDAGFVGEMVVIRGGKGLERGAAIPVPREGTLGTTRTNDLCVPVVGVKTRHLWFRFDDRKGLMVEPIGKSAINVDGYDFQSRRDPLYMAHGSRLYVGEAELRLRLFAGFECTAHAVRRTGVEDEQPASQQPDQAQIAQQAAYQQWLQQQWMMQQQAWQQGYQQAMAQQAEPEYEEADEILYDAADVYTYEAAREQGRVDHSAFMRPVGEQKPELSVYEQKPDPVPEAAALSPETEVEPVEEDWPYMPEPVEEEDMTDAAVPPKSAYVGYDEAEKAKRHVWDKYFGGGQR